MSNKARFKSVTVLLTVLLVVLFFTFGGECGVVSPELEQALLQAAPGQVIPVIVHLRDQVDVDQFRDMEITIRRAEIIKALREQAAQSLNLLMGVLAPSRIRAARSLWIINGLALRADPQTIRSMADEPAVEKIVLDYVITLGVENEGDGGNLEWNLEAIGVPDLWALGYTGQGVVVASMDSGVDVLHPDLAPRWRGGGNSWFDPHGEHDQPYDKHGHGTQTMGVIVGGEAGGTAIGVAPDAQWIAVKIFNDAGEAPLSAIHQGYQWLLDPDGDPETDDAPQVVNNSWDFEAPGQCLDEFQEDINVLRVAGIAVVFAAGNYGPNPASSVSPANNPGAFAVGAVDEALILASSSSRGPSACDGAVFPRLVAPGVNVKTTDLSLGGFALYAYSSGTSLAAPHVSGAMALLLCAFPGLGLSELEQALEDSAVHPGGTGPDNQYGYGVVNVFEAYQLLASTLDPCEGDINGDGVVDQVDVPLLAADFGKTGCLQSGGCAGDLNGDGVVDGRDLNLLAGDYGRTDCGS